MTDSTDTLTQDYTYRASVLRIIDGDTVEAALDCGLSVHVVEKLRLAGINAPEMRGATRPDGEAAAAFLAELVGDGEIFVRTIKDRRGKYGRYLAVLLDRTGRDLNQAMVDAGHAELWGITRAS